MKVNHILLILSIILSASSCNNKPKENISTENTAQVDNRIDSIKVLYFNHLIEPTTPIKPEDIQINIPKFELDRKGVLDAHIIDSIKIINLKSKIDALIPMEQSAPLDARLVATLIYKDGRKDLICLGGQYVNEIFVNGIQQQPNNELIFLLKNYAGFYPWMIGDDMFAMKELQDDSFSKAPFSSTNYYNDYQKALASR